MALAAISFLLAIPLGCMLVTRFFPPLPPRARVVAFAIVTVMPLLIAAAMFGDRIDHILASLHSRWPTAIGLDAGVAIISGWLEGFSVGMLYRAWSTPLEE